MDNKIEQKESDGKGMFFIEQEGKIVGHLRYSLKDNNILTLDHTEVEPEMSGKGLAGDLVKHSVAFARKKNLMVDPLCAYAAKQFERNEEYQDLLVNPK